MPADKAKVTVVVSRPVPLELLKKYADSDIHNVTAYLATLK